MFQGAAQLNLDDKGRLAIPARYRESLLLQGAGSLVLTADFEPCVLLYPLPEWQQVAARLSGLSSMHPKVRALQRRLIGHADEVQMDSAGRVLVSPVLRELAGLEKQVMLVGQANKFELWSSERWHALQADLSFLDGDLPAELEGFSL